MNILNKIGIPATISNQHHMNGELCGDVSVESSSVDGFEFVILCYSIYH